MLTTGISHCSIVSLKKFIKLNLMAVFPGCEIGISSLKILVKFGFHGLFLIKPSVLLDNKTLIILVHGCILGTDLLVKHVSEADSLLAVLGLESLNSGKVILVVFVDKIVLLADFIGMALFNLGTFLEPCVPIGLVLVVTSVDFIVLRADLSIMALLLATSFSSMIVLQSLRAFCMVLV